MLGITTNKHKNAISTCGQTSGLIAFGFLMIEQLKIIELYLSELRAIHDMNYDSGWSNALLVEDQSLGHKSGTNHGVLLKLSLLKKRLVNM